MENNEHTEALAVIDSIAAEIHAEYAKVAKQGGHELPAWDDINESMKKMPRTLARLTLSKMETVYEEAFKKATKLAAEKSPAPAAPPPPAAAAAKETLGDKSIFFENLTKLVEETAARLIDKQAIAREGNPITQGIDNAVRKLVESLTIKLLSEDEGIKEALTTQITTAINEGLLGGDENDGDDKEKS